MESQIVRVVATGSANLASVRAALHRLGARVELVETPEQIEDARAVVLPGVGAFAAAMQGLRDRGLVEPLRRRILAGRPTLAVCLGMQLLAEASEESPEEQGLAVWPGHVRRFEGPLPIPQIGWNTVRVDDDGGLLEDGAAYFANSYALEAPPSGARVGWTEYGRRFPAAIEKEGVLACQFHPELSGRWGADLLGRWWEVARC